MIKPFKTFITGIVSGIILTIFSLVFIGKCSSPTNDITLFITEGECVSTNDFRVFQVLENGNALASTRYLDIVVLFLAKKGQSYYDDQIIKIPHGKCAKQIGVYRYITTEEREKTVPVVAIRDKK